MSLEPGSLLRGRYEIVRLIKSGGFGSVCEARDVNLANSPCAIKEVLESALGGPNGEYIRNTFEKEMQALVNLDHPSIPKVRDYFQDGDRRYIVMEFVKGMSLEDEIVEHMQTAGRGLPPGKVVADILLLLDTVAYLHRLKPPILHRDIKPANIIRDDKTGRIKLVDFGLAKAVSETLSPQTMVGTLGFCAPEQLSGKAETRSDLYSVGATMYQMLSGVAPQLTFDPMVLEIPGLRPGLDRLIAKVTEPRAADRYNRAEEMAADLRTWQSGNAVSSVYDSQATEPVDGSSMQAAAPSTVLVQAANHSQWAWVAVVGMAVGLGLLVGRMGHPAASADTEVTVSSSPSASISPEPVAAQPLAVATPSTTTHSGIKHTEPPILPHHQQPASSQAPKVQQVASTDQTKVPSLGEDQEYPVGHPLHRARKGAKPAQPARPANSGADGDFNKEITSVNYFVASLRRYKSLDQVADKLSEDSRLREDWQYDPGYSAFPFVAMTGTTTRGGYILKQGKVEKIIFRPYPNQEQFARLTLALKQANPGNRTGRKGNRRGEQ